MTNQPSKHEWLMKDDELGADAAATAEFVKVVVQKNIEADLNAPPIGEEGKVKLRAMVDLEAMDRLQAMNDKSERALIYHVSEVSAQGEYIYAPGEPETIGEWLASALDATKSKSEYSDLKFIAEQLVPYMVKMNIANAPVLWAAGYKKKARTAVPYLRFLFKEAPPDLAKRVKEVIEWVVNPKITKQHIEEALAKARGVTPPIPALCTETIITGGKTRLIIECDNEQLIVIKKRLKNLINITGSDPTPVKKELQPQGASI